MRNKKVKKIAWVIFVSLLIAVLFFDLLTGNHGTSGFDGSMFFYAWLGFASCAVIILISNLLGVFLKKHLNYYAKDKSRRGGK